MSALNNRRVCFRVMGYYSSHSYFSSILLNDNVVYFWIRSCCARYLQIIFASVPKFKSRKNYDEWTFVENVLVLESMLHCVQSVVGKVINVEDNAKARPKLCLTIYPASYVHIKKMNLLKKLWGKLKSLFDDSCFRCRFRYYITCKRRQNSKDMTTFVTQIWRHHIKFWNNHQWIRSLMLSELPERFTPIIMAFVIKTKL